MRIKKILSLLVVISIGTSLFAQSKKTDAIKNAREVYDEALKKDTAQEIIDYLNQATASIATNADRRSLLFVTGTIQEQCGLYENASLSYAQAAGIAAGDADNMPKVSPEQLVINAVRASLLAGDSETADRYLNSAVRSSKDEKILACINLYAQWSALCKAQSLDETKDSVSLLKAYCSMDSMKSVKPTILLTLWYVTGEKSYGDELQKEFPASPEAGVVTGKVQIMSVPFWYFVPHSGGSDITFVPETDSLEPTTIASVAESSTQKDVAAEQQNDSSKKDDVSENDGKITREQCGLFREEANAKALVEQLKKKGFDAKITTEKRASGTTYYIVVVDENKEGTVGLKLRDAGFECYPVVE